MGEGKAGGRAGDVFVLTTSCGPDEVELVGWAKQSDLVDAGWRETLSEADADPAGGKAAEDVGPSFLAAVDAHP